MKCYAASVEVEVMFVSDSEDQQKLESQARDFLEKEASNAIANQAGPDVFESSGMAVGWDGNYLVYGSNDDNLTAEKALDLNKNADVPSP